MLKAKLVSCPIFGEVFYNLARIRNEVDNLHTQKIKS